MKQRRTIQWSRGMGYSPCDATTRPGTDKAPKTRCDKRSAPATSRYEALRGS